MSRTLLYTLRTLAVGGALTLLACHVMNKQEQANVPPPPAPAGAAAATQPAVYMSGTKSLQVLDSTAAPGAHLHGTKSARILTPQDVSPDAKVQPQMLPGSKSGMLFHPGDFQQTQQQTPQP